MRYVRLPVALCASASLLLPVAALGQAGKQLDPDSPAGVEYQLPLEQARKNATGGGENGPGSRRGRAGGEGGASLFGAGIVAVKGSAREDGGGGGRRSLASIQQGSRRSDAGGRREADGIAVRPSTLQAPDETGGSATLRIAGIALAVLLAGGLLGLALRRGLRQSLE